MLFWPQWCSAHVLPSPSRRSRCTWVRRRFASHGGFRSGKTGKRHISPCHRRRGASGMCSTRWLSKRRPACIILPLANLLRCHRVWEASDLGRQPTEITALSGYAGGTEAGPWHGSHRRFNTKENQRVLGCREHRSRGSGCRVLDPFCFQLHRIEQSW